MEIVHLYVNSVPLWSVTATDLTGSVRESLGTPDFPDSILHSVNQLLGISGDYSFNCPGLQAPGVGRRIVWQMTEDMTDDRWQMTDDRRQKTEDRRHDTWQNTNNRRQNTGDRSRVGNNQIVIVFIDLIMA